MDKSVRTIVYAIAALLVIGLVVVHYAPYIRRPSLEGLARDGNVVVSALEKFKEDSGAYPDKLDDLVPQYLYKIPLPTFMVQRRWPHLAVPHPWVYELTADKMAFTLRAAIYVYDSRDGVWAPRSIRR